MKRPAILPENLATYKANQGMLEACAWGEWILIHKGKIIQNDWFSGIGFPSYDDVLHRAKSLLADGENPLMFKVGGTIVLEESGCRELEQAPPRPSTIDSLWKQAHIDLLPPKCTLDDNIKAYDALIEPLKDTAWGEWVIVHNKQLVKNGIAQSFVSDQDAFRVAHAIIVGGGTPLVQQIGAENYLTHKGTIDSRLPSRVVDAAHPMFGLRTSAPN